MKVGNTQLSSVICININRILEQLGRGDGLTCIFGSWMQGDFRRTVGPVITAMNGDDYIVRSSVF